MKLFSKKQSMTPRRRLSSSDDVSLKLSGAFRRSQTLVKKAVGDSNSVDLGIDSPRTHIHNLATKRRKIFGVFLIVLASVILLWLLISNFTATVNIVTPELSTSKSIDNSRYSSVIQEYFDTNPFGRFSFFLDQAALSDYVANKLPEVKSVVEKNMTSIGETNFSVIMRIPVAGWKIGDKKYYVDAAGTAFEKNYFDEPAVQIVDNSGASLQTGSASVSKRFLSFVGRIIAASQSSGYPVIQAVLPINTTRELDIILKDSGLLVKLSIDRKVGEQIEDMSRAVQYFKNSGRVPTYIDVRVSGKAFFK
jgi:hypothetical protein